MNREVDPHHSIPPLPRYITLSGFDTFHLVSDLRLRKVGSKGNVCILDLKFSGDTQINTVIQLIHNTSTFKYLSNFKLSGLIRKRWEQKVKFDEHLKLAKFDNDRDLDQFILKFSIRPELDPPFTAFAYRVLHPARIGVLFVWHHALLDAHGAELAINMISSEISGSSNIKSENIAYSTGSALSLINVLPQIRDTTRMIKGILGSSAYFPQSKDSKPTQAYVQRELDSDQQSRLRLNYSRLKMDYLRSVFHLACSTKALKEKSELLGLDDKDLSVIVPHDLRRSFRTAKILTDRVSALFFRIPKEKLTMDQLTDEILSQLQAIVSKRSAEALLKFFHLIAYLPLSIFLSIVNYPSSAQGCTVYFSDTGDTLSKVSAIGQFKIDDAIHYPPLIAPPPLSIFFTQYMDKIRVTLSFDSNYFKIAQMDELADRIVHELTSEAL